ncbi:hypothetical protein Tco_1272606 [Tanacetum coccineum]
MIATNSKIEDKKPLELILPPMDILETFPCVKDVDYITWDLAVSSVSFWVDDLDMDIAAGSCWCHLLTSLHISKKFTIYASSSNGFYWLCYIPTGRLYWLKKVQISDSFATTQQQSVTALVTDLRQKYGH